MIEHPLEHHPEFSPYHYCKDFYFPEVRCVGWLHGDNEFIVGTVPSSFLPRLKELVVSSDKGIFSIEVNQVRGFHSCPVCGKKPVTVIDGEGKSLLLGSAELWVPDNATEGSYFATSDLIIHYVLDHHYQPPQEFIDSVLALGVDSDFNGEVVKDTLAEKYTGYSFSSILNGT